MPNMGAYWMTQLPYCPPSALMAGSTGAHWMQPVSDPNI